MARVLVATAARALGGECGVQDGRVWGTISSGDGGQRVEQNLAYAFVDPNLQGQITVDILGELVPALVIPDGPYDPENTLVRA